MLCDTIGWQQIEKSTPNNEISNEMVCTFNGQTLEWSVLSMYRL